MQFSSIHTMVVKTAGRLALLSICSIMPAVYADTLDAVRKVAGESVEVATVAAVNAGEVAASVPSERGAEEVSDEASASPPEEKIIPWAWGNKWLQGTINRAGGDNEFDPADGIDWGYVPKRRRKSWV